MKLEKGGKNLEQRVEKLEGNEKEKEEGGERNRELEERVRKMEDM